MKYLILLLILFGFAGTAFAEMNYPDVLKIPFDDSDLVLVGTIISKNEISNQTEYGIDVENYLKNSKSFDMISAISYETKNQDGPYTEVHYYNEPFFDVGQKVFVYLKMNVSGEYVMSAYSFALEKNEAKGPPATNLFPLSTKYEYKYGENVTISGIVKKSYLYFESLKDEDTNVYVTVLNPENKQYLSDKVHINLDGTFDYSFTPKGNLAIGGMYSYSIGTKQESWEGGFLVDVLTPNASPYKQHKSGITNDKITCKEGMVLVTKSSDDSPACVKEKTIPKLIDRGWTAESETKLWKSTDDWNSMRLVRNDDGLYCNSSNEKLSDQCYSLDEIVFGDDNKMKETGWKLYPGGAGWTLPENSTLSPIYKNVEFGIPPLDFTAMLDDKIFVNKCESNGGIWNYTYHDCQGIGEICQNIDGIGVSMSVSMPCTGFCLDPGVYRVACVFEYEN